MGALLQILGLACLAVWAYLEYGRPWAFLVAGVGLIIAGIAVSDVALKLPGARLRRKRGAPRGQDHPNGDNY